jgi:hypothetical protein
VAVLAATLAIVGVAATWWLVGQPDAEVASRGSAPEGKLAEPVDCGAAPYLNRITGIVPRDVEVTAHGTVCKIRGTVQGTLTVRDEGDPCDEKGAITAVDVVGGIVEGDIVALGSACVMVFLEDGARVEGDVIYRATGNLGFLGEAEGAWVGGNVFMEGGRLWAHGASITNRVDGDLVCDGGRPKQGLGSGSEENWDGFQQDVDGTLGGTYRSC